MPSDLLELLLRVAIGRFSISELGRRLSSLLFGAVGKGRHVQCRGNVQCMIAPYLTPPSVSSSSAITTINLYSTKFV
jgi:hypothetical protein